MYFLCIACLVSGTERYKRTDLHEKMECVVKKASHGIRLGSWEWMSVVELIDHGACWIGWFGGVHANAYTMFICVGLNGLMNTVVL